MAGSFDPYREWLAVASNGDSHNHYELLGVRPLESDINKINSAFRRQSDRLAAHLSGAQAALAQRLMSELTEARMTLLTPTAKRAYDASLAAGQVPPSPSARPTMKTARWSGSPGPESDDTLLPPTATPPTEMPGATPAPAMTGHAADSPFTAAPYQTPAAQPSPYAAMQPAAGVPATATPVYAQPVQAYPAAGHAPQAYAQAYAPPGYPSPAQFGAAPVAQAVPVEPAPQASTFSAAGYRAARRRRSSAAPLAAGVLLAALVLLGGVYWKINADRKVAAMGDPARKNSTADSKTEPAAKRSPTAQPTITPRTVQPSPSPPENREVPSTAAERQPKISNPEPSPTERSNAAAMADGDPPALMPDAPPKTDTPEPEPKAEAMASPEEAAAVSRALRAARAALAVRDLSLAQEQVDQAMLDATAPDTLDEVARVELLTKYAEIFWEAARGTLGKLQAAEEIEIEGEVASVVDASADRLTLRIAGQNREYTLNTLPPKVALYLARRWLAPNDPASDVAVAAFHLADPKGDREEARRLLQSAAAGGIDVKPLLAELDAIQKKSA